MPRTPRNHILGGVLMGFGGVTALGCTIGQGITGFSTLALGSIITFVAIIAGSAATMKWQYWRLRARPDKIAPFPACFPLSSIGFSR